MPGGRGHGRGRRRGQGRRRRVLSFIRPCLLTLLHRGPVHGYSLLDGLTEFGFQAERLDASLVYRALRDMEEKSLVVSEWDDDSLGPQRRMYSITDAGEKSLDEWVADLRKTQEDIEKLLKAYQQVITKDEHD